MIDSGCASLPVGGSAYQNDIYMDEKEMLIKMRERQKEINLLPLHNFGRWTPFYKEAMPLFKTAPWRLGIILAIWATIVIYFLLGPSFLKLASLLGRGF